MTTSFGKIATVHLPQLRPIVLQMLAELDT
jgi:hypothetical protein